MSAEGIVLVTGGSRGIGAATATLLAEQGRRVVIVDIAPEPLAGTKTILWPAPFDVASESAVVSGIADIEAAHGPITGLVNAAGVFGKMHPVERVRMEQWDREVNIDLRGTFLVARSVGVQNGRAPPWRHRQCRLGRRHDLRPDPRLYRRKGRRHPDHADAGRRMGPRRRARQCGVARLHPHRGAGSRHRLRRAEQGACSKARRR